MNRAPDKRGHLGQFKDNPLPTKTYAVTPHKNRLNERVPMRGTTHTSAGQYRNASKNYSYYQLVFGALNE